MTFLPLIEIILVEPAVCILRCLISHCGWFHPHNILGRHTGNKCAMSGQWPNSGFLSDHPISALVVGNGPWSHEYEESMTNVIIRLNLLYRYKNTNIKSHGKINNFMILRWYWGSLSKQNPKNPVLEGMWILSHRLRFQSHLQPKTAMRQLPLERDINITVNACSGFTTSTQKVPFMAMLISCSRGTYLIKWFESSIGSNHFSCLLWFCTHAQSCTSLCHHLLPMLLPPSPLWEH